MNKTTPEQRTAFFHRMLDEHRELLERNTRLTEFLASLVFDVLPHEEKRLLLKQHQLQSDLLEVLGQRIYLVRERMKKDLG